MMDLIVDSSVKNALWIIAALSAVVLACAIYSTQVHSDSVMIAMSILTSGILIASAYSLYRFRSAVLESTALEI